MYVCVCVRKDFPKDFTISLLCVYRMQYKRTCLNHLYKCRKFERKWPKYICTYLIVYV